MRCFVAKLCVVLLMFNSVAFAGGLQRGIMGKAKQIGIGALATIMLTCGTIACSKDKVISETPKREVAALSYDQSTTVNELITDIEQLQGAQIGVVKSIDYNQDAITIETADGVVSMHLAKGEVLVNNGEADLEVILSQEAFDEGLIAEGSWIAIIPGVAFGAAWPVLLGIGFYRHYIRDKNPFRWSNQVARDAVYISGATSLISGLLGISVYQILVWL